MFQNFQIKVFFEESFDMNGGKEDAAKVGKSLNNCKEVAGEEAWYSFPDLFSAGDSSPFPVRKSEKT